MKFKYKHVGGNTLRISRGIYRVMTTFIGRQGVHKIEEEQTVNIQYTILSRHYIDSKQTAKAYV